MGKQQKIMCMFHDGARSEYDITVDGRVWPCCKFVNVITKIEAGMQKKGALDGDDYFFKLQKDDPNWNSLEHHSLEEILDHDYFSTYVNNEGWESGNTSVLCKKRCTANMHNDGTYTYVADTSNKIHKRIK
tara:strand:+ start:27 stop:419 length:393 start_codon:yes stop_codon:yes gene_type:complete